MSSNVSFNSQGPIWSSSHSDTVSQSPAVSQDWFSYNASDINLLAIDSQLTTTATLEQLAARVLDNILQPSSN